MAGFVRRTAAWLGLVSDGEDEFSDEEFSEAIYRSNMPEPSASVTPIRTQKAKVSTKPKKAEPIAQPVPEVQQVKQEVDMSRIIALHPKSYSEAPSIGENFMEGVPVIMNLSQMNSDEAKDLMNFAVGLTFGLGGTMEKIISGVFLLSPSNVVVTVEDKERIRGAFYNQS